MVKNDLLHPGHEVVHILVDDGLKGAQGAGAKGRGDLPGHVPVADRVLLPDQAAEVLAAVLEVGLDKVLHVLVLRRVDVREGLGREEGELVGCDPDGRAVLVQRLLDRPGPPSGYPVVGIP